MLEDSELEYRIDSTLNLYPSGVVASKGWGFKTEDRRVVKD